MDFNIKLSNGQVLKGLIRSPGENIRAVVILIHGLGEHIQRYNSLSDCFIQEGIGFTGIDLPGHGRSEGRRGYIKNYNILREVIDIMLKSCKQTFPGIPIFIYGHSLGGGIVIDYLLHRNPKIKGAIVTSPWLRLSFEPSKIKLFIASVMKYLLPGLTQPSGLVVEYISHDKTVVEDYKNDPLVHGKISVSLCDGAFSSATYSLANASELKIHTLLLHGSNDLICSPEGSREFADKTDMVEFKIWDGGYHELHNELFKDDVFVYILSWINKQLA
ncbi:MAG TPA: lysophospholipase [Bacteroidales bacterium]|nr:lysophospholipase [Bacteroidales bacterium]